ncbi:MAG: HEAT repeat domain-containing protein [Candidatus Omnitrophica bacterium]|nr:HEAT repeat domain-containing protein [Candidatus Omnitrophota bacterium]
MNEQLESLRKKHKQLMVVIGETLSRLYSQKAVSFRYEDESGSDEKEVEKLMRLESYLRERIGRYEEVFGDGDEDDEDCCADECDACEGCEEEEKTDENEEPASEEALEVHEIEPEKPVEEECCRCCMEDSAPHEEPVSSEVSLPVREPVEDISIIDIAAKADLASDAERRIFEKGALALQKGNVREKEMAVSQISHVKDRDALRKAYAFAMNDESPAVRLAVVKQIARSNDDDNEGLFRRAVGDAEARIRVAAVKGIGSFVSERRRAFFEELMASADQEIRGLAVTYLGIYYGRDGIKKAREAVLDESPYVRKSLLEMISVVKPDGGLATVKDMLSDKDAEVRKAAEEALDKLISERKKGRKQ